MPSNALYLKASQLYGLAWVLLLVFVFEDVIPTVLVVAGISLQRILVVFIQRNDYIPFESRAITLDKKSPLPNIETGRLTYSSIDSSSSSGLPQRIEPTNGADT